MSDTNNRIRELLSRITALEDEIETIMQQQTDHVLYQLKDGKIHFDREIEAAQLRARKAFGKWLRDSSPPNILSAPFLYGLFIPMLILDICLTLYQRICFPLYRMGTVQRNSYIIIDRHHLRFLNGIEKLNCAYCAYANGLVAYAREIASRTEQYWCPIKHASRLKDRHARYHDFIEYGDAADYYARLKEYREQLRKDSAGRS